MSDSKALRQFWCNYARLHGPNELVRIPASDLLSLLKQVDDSEQRELLAKMDSRTAKAEPE